MPDIPQIPHNTEAEEAVLGSIMIDPSALGKVQAIITPEMFYLQKHRFIYEAAIDLDRAGEPLDFLTLTTKLQAQGRLEIIGSAVYLSQLVNSTPSALNVESYARLILDAHKRRKLLDLVSDVSKLAFNEGKDLHAAAEYVQARLGELFTQTYIKREYQPFSELAKTLPPIQWLWPSWIPRGMITLLGAVPGAGKSLLALDLAKRVIMGQPFPDGTPSPYPAGTNVIYVDAEMVPQLIKDRAEVWKIDMDHLYQMLPKANDALDFSRPDYQERLRSMVATLKPGLIVIDSLSSVSTKGENSIEDVRAVLGFFNELANSYQVALLLIHHLRKKNSMQMNLPGISIDDFRGSSHIIAMSRSVIGLSVVQTGPDTDRNGPRKIEIVKTNLGAYPEPLGAELIQLHPRGVMLQWIGDAPEAYKEPSQLELCADWLLELLKEADEPLPPKEVVAAGKDEGYSRATVYRARSNMKGQIVTVGQRPNTAWELRQ